MVMVYPCNTLPQNQCFLSNNNLETERVLFSKGCANFEYKVLQIIWPIWEEEGKFFLGRI